MINVYIMSTDELFASFVETEASLYTSVLCYQYDIFPAAELTVRVGVSTGKMFVVLKDIASQQFIVITTDIKRDSLIYNNSVLSLFDGETVQYRGVQIKISDDSVRALVAINKFFAQVEIFDVRKLDAFIDAISHNVSAVNRYVSDEESHSRLYMDGNNIMLKWFDTTYTLFNAQSIAKLVMVAELSTGRIMQPSKKTERVTDPEEFAIE